MLPQVLPILLSQVLYYFESNTRSATIIGIVDSGIRASHLELSGRVIAARNFASGYPATLIEDRDGHGTHVAGIAAASGNGSVRGPSRSGIGSNPRSARTGLGQSGW